MRHPKAVEKLAILNCPHPDRFLRDYYRALFRRNPTQNKKLLRRIEAPVVVIWGEEDRYLGTELAEPETSWVPNVRVERLLNASDWVQQDSFHRVNALLLEFLRAPNRCGGTRNVNTSMSDPRAGLAFDNPLASEE
jgi:pimeloyl-ACP methyl ester carboxylesterase